MTTATFTAMSTPSHRALPVIKRASFVERRAALPDMDAAGTLLARTADLLSHGAIAAIPFAALGWLFIAR